MKHEVGDAARDLDGVADEGVTWRLAQAAEARNQATLNQTEDKTTFERADNGLLISREEKDVFERMLAGLSMTKGKDSDG